ncbi:phage tail length tape measure family protein [Brevundimonas vancanneytii]|uniref:Prophage tail length tape measure protein n=1 Tax=Brevundimonas vancanneytii TaxID=1325724 RepID=A0A4P1JRF0_9CAUL|nr:phage tail length tape measure family protein [Brevundimonas vancanneytii]VTO10695.1 Prophage tail length tape measure protein [Brevundimonas vancanneytii]
MTTKQIALRIEAQGGQDAVRIAQTVENAVERMNKSAESGSDKAAVAKKREVQALLDYAAAARNAERAANDQASSVQARINAATGVTGGTNARASAAARTFEAAERGYDRRAQVLLETLNPLWAAQQKLNQELAEYDALAKRGKISTEQMAQAQTLARQRFNETTAALERQGKGLSRNVMASRLNLTRQGADVFTTAAMGMNPAMIAIQQGPQILDAWSTSAIKLTGPLTLLVGSVGLLAGATGAMAVAWAQAEKSTAALDRAATGLGRTAKMSGAELKAAADAGAEAGNISLKSARDMASAYVSTGKIGGEVMSGLVAITKDFAAFMGVDAKSATEMLAKAMSEPDKAARDFTRQFGLLDQKTLDHIDSLIKLGDRTAAQKVLMEALTGAMSGHADKVDDLSSFWDVATRSMSNYWTKLGEWLQTTRDERIENLELRRDLAATPFARRQAETKLFTETFLRDWENRERETAANSAAANQTAQEAKDRADAGKKDRDKAARDAERARREAERQARELLQRARREEDVSANLSLQEAKATNDFDRVRSLEAEVRVRARVRQLEDDGVAAAEAKSRAMQEEQRILEAMKVQRDEEGLKLQRQGEMDVMRLLGEERSLRNLQDRIAQEERVQAFQKAGYDLLTATNLAEAERNRLVEARTVAMKRALQDAKTEHRLNLLRLSGDDEEYRRLSVADRVQRRAGEIEQRGGLNRGEAQKQAEQEIKEELDATALGARRAWMRDMLSDIRSGGIGDALAGQLERATDKWADKLADMLAGLDWGGALKAMFGGGGGMSGALGALFSGGEGHAAGTDFSPGGWKWVGERGPELLNLPRGSRVLEHNRALQAAAGGGAMNVSLGGLTIKNYGSEPMTGRLSKAPGGGMELELEPLFKNELAKAGRDGSLARSLNASPRPRRR